jgi:transposase InsO family protein/transposase
MFEAQLSRRLSVLHAKAALTPSGRLILCRRIAAGRPVAHVAAEMGVARATAYKWWHRYGQEGVSGLLDRSSRPHRVHRIAVTVEDQIDRLRRQRKWGPLRIAACLEMSPSTVRRVLVRRGLGRLAWLDRPTGRVIRRYEREQPGELVHVDVKKLGRIPEGGGWHAQGRSYETRRRQKVQHVGYDFVHSCVDDHSRLAYCEILSDERGPTCAGFLRRAAAWFGELGIPFERVMTDNARNYRAAEAFRMAVAELGARQMFTQPYRPQLNGKVERFNRTLLEEWAYVRPYTSNQERSALLAGYLHSYNHHRSHTALGSRPPISRVSNLAAQYS